MNNHTLNQKEKVYSSFFLGGGNSFFWRFFCVFFWCVCFFHTFKRLPWFFGVAKHGAPGDEHRWSLQMTSVLGRRFWLQRNPPTFHHTGWFIGILILAYQNPFKTKGNIIPYTT